MKWTELLRKDNYALLQSETDTQYAVVSGYDPMQPEDQQWHMEHILLIGMMQREKPIACKML